MTFAELKLKIYRYILPSSNAAVAVDSAYDPIIAQAINAARKWAERDHDFDYLRVSVTGVVPSSGYGLDWTAALPGRYDDSGTNYYLKRVEDVYLQTSTGDIPIRHTTRKQQAQRIKDLPMPALVPDEVEYIDEGDGEITKAVLHGNRLFLSPQRSENTTVTIDGIRWATEYTNSGDEDWMLKHGHDFLFWQAVVELNHSTKTFVYRQEGNVMPPDKLANLAYATLKDLDNYIAEGNNNYDRE